MLEDDVRFEAVSALGEVYEAEGQASNAKQVLQRALELSRSHAYWHCRILFQLAVRSEYEKTMDIEILIVSFYRMSTFKRRILPALSPTWDRGWI